jgi:hypothetical protein
VNIGAPAVLTLLPPERVAGVVRSEASGAVVAGAFVWASEPGDAVRSAEDGTFSLIVSDTKANSTADGESLSLRATATGHRPGRVAVSATQVRPGGAPIRPADLATFSLRPAGTVHGEVVDRAAGLVANAEVRLERLDAFGAFFARDSARNSVRTGAAGRFAFSDLELHVPYRLEARSGEESSQRVDVRLADATQPQHAVLELRPWRRISGTVVDEQDQPVAEAAVGLRRGPSPDSRIRTTTYDFIEFDYAAISGEAGRFELLDVTDGTHELEVRADGYAPLLVPGITISAHEGREGSVVDVGIVQLLPGVSLSGTVTDSDGVPLSGAAVWARSQLRRTAPLPSRGYKGEADARTDRGGRFLVGDLVPGVAITLAVELEGYLPFFVDGLSVDIESADDREPIVVELAPAASLEGVVVGAQGEPLVDVRIDLQLESHDLVGEASENLGSASASGRSAADGRFTIEGLRSGRWELRARKVDFRETTLPGLEVRADAEREPVRVVLAEGATLEGTVLGPAGEPVAGADVWLLIDGSRSFGGNHQRRRQLPHP